jgi:Electron transfer DM13
MKLNHYYFHKRKMDRSWKSSPFVVLSLTLLLTLAIAKRLSAQPVDGITPQGTELATVANSFISIDEGHYTTGRVRIIQDNGKNYLELDRAFSTLKGPELKVILYRDRAVPFSISRSSDYLSLSPLQDFQGKQKYLISDRIDLSQYASVAIWCEKFNITFAYAALPQIITVITSGELVGFTNDRSTRGTVSMIEEWGQRYLQFDNSFITKSDRQINIVLNRNSAIAGKIKSKEYISLASLKKPKGKQRYAVPEDINIKNYNLVLIWCKDSNLPLAYASLQAR